MFRSKYGFANEQSPSIQLFSLLVLFLVGVQHGEIVQRSSGIWMFRSQNTFTNCQRLLVQLLGLVVPAFPIAQNGSDSGMLIPQYLLSNLPRFLKIGFGLLKSALNSAKHCVALQACSPATR